MRTFLMLVALFATTACTRYVDLGERPLAKGINYLVDCPVAVQDGSQVHCEAVPGGPWVCDTLRTTNTNEQVYYHIMGYDPCTDKSVCTLVVATKAESGEVTSSTPKPLADSSLCNTPDGGATD